MGAAWLLQYEIDHPTVRNTWDQRTAQKCVTGPAGAVDSKRVVEE